ncbi:F-box protein At5g03970-like [Rutidosis leptorrhynchoides]|uniref:F-box protein At5g03970-like n=1 Tax=Rutidosis leptorrhynchoides TaxID=125765 RepID=UPI003A993ED4
MENEEEVHSDGSFELVNIDEYESELELMADVVSNNMEFSDGSYDFLCSEVSETDTITEGVAEIDLDNNQSEGDSEINSEANSDDTEGDVSEFSNETNSDSDLEIQPSPKKGKKRNLMTMLLENPNLDVLYKDPDLNFSEFLLKEAAKSHIIPYLPAKSLARSRLVSKEWNRWISGPFFAHIQSQHFRKTSGFFQNKAEHSTHSSFFQNYPEDSTHFISLEHSAYGVPSPSLSFIPRRVSVRSSCNGLLLCQDLDELSKYIVCNPANQKWVKIPPSSYYHGEKPKIVLAFEPSSLNFEPCYKAVCPFSLPDLTDGPIVYFDIYDSKTQSWRVSDMICVDMTESELESEGLFVNGVAYWVTTGGVLLAFDLKNEIYGLQTIPFSGGSLSKISGEICYVKAQHHHVSRSCSLDVYGGGFMSLKKTIKFKLPVIPKKSSIKASNYSYGVEDDYVMDCVVLANSCDDVIAVTMEMSNGRFVLYAYHVNDQKVEGPWHLKGSRDVFPYVSSLVPLTG